MNQNSKKDDYRFLKEQPLQGEYLDNLKFGHNDIANTITDIVTKCDTPFTIGLFGKWGSGKSTIINKIETNLKSLQIPAKDRIPVVVFDVWKHEGDLLRRPFLKECQLQLKAYGSKYFDQNYDLDKKLERSVTEQIIGGLKFNKKLFIQIVKIITFVVAFIILITMDFNSVKLIPSLITQAILVAIIVFFLKILFIVENSVYNYDKFKEPHEFQEEFGKLINALKVPKALIVFDNLDRATHKKAVETLTTIKTFLEPEDKKNSKVKIVFLIPCDDQAIREHIKAEYNINTNGKSAFDPDE